MIELNPREVNAMGDGAMREQMIDLIDQLAREWDACEFDGGGGCVIDIGDAVRTAGFRRVHALFAASPVAADTMGDAKDAARYRWLKTNSDCINARGMRWTWDQHDYVPDDTLDAAIDAAITEGKLDA